MYRTWKFNILKTDKAHPRIYHIACGLTPGKDKDIDFPFCTYFKKK